MRPLTDEELAAIAERKVEFDEAMADRKATSNRALDELARQEAAARSFSSPDSWPDSRD